MRPTFAFFFSAIAVVAVGIPAASASASPDPEPIHEARWVAVDLSAALPADLVEPEGKTRWELGSLVGGERGLRRVLRPARRAGELLDQRAAVDGLGPRAERLIGRGAADDAERWLLPQRDSDLLAVRPGPAIELERAHPGGERERLWIRTRRVGLGWAFLPSGPREVVLQRALVLRRDVDEKSYRPHELVHRWIDPRAGVVAEVSGPASADGRRRLRITAASFVEEVTLGNTPLKLYIDEFDRPVRAVLRLGYDQERRCTNGGNLCRTIDECAGGADVCAEIPVSILTPDAPASIGALVNAGAWDFSANNLTNFPNMERTASTTVEVSAEQTSAFGECGFSNGARRMSREDKNFDNPNIGTNDGDLNITASVTERTGGVTSAGTVWLRGAIKNEGVPGSGFTSQSRACHDPASDSQLTPVPLWEFANLEDNPDPQPDRWFMDFGDSWANETAFACEPTIFTVIPLFPDMLWVRDCGDLGGLSGKQSGEVVEEGPVTLPSGHTFNSLVVRNTVEYCAYGGSSCSSIVKFQAVRVVLHLWQVPNLGTVVRLQSGTSAPSPDGFSTLDETDIKYGLFPPRSITVTGTGADSVDLSWDPGLVTDHIGRYRIYWDEVSGASNSGAYAFDSGPGGVCSGMVCTGDGATACLDDNDCSNPDVSFNGTSATISGLTPGVEYFFTVTSITEHCPPALCANNPCAPTCPQPQSGCAEVQCNVVRSIESPKFPIQVPGPQPVPAEVSATPGAGCSPALPEVGDEVLLDKLNPGIRICWPLATDDRIDGYRILGADTPESADNYRVLVEDTGLTNCATLDPSERYFLVIAKGACGGGPWGHYGR